MTIQLRSRRILTTVGVVALVVVVAVSLYAGFYFGKRSAPATAAAAPDNAAAATMYTCSMHPQVRLPDADAKCPICFMDLIPVVDDADDADRGAPVLRMTASAMALADIRTTPVVRDYPTARVRLVGRLEYDESRVTTIAAYFPGRLERLFVDYTGVAVRLGDHLAEVYSPELLAAQEELRLSAESARRSGGATGLLRDSSLDTLAAARDKLRLWGLTPEQIAHIESSDESIERFTIYSPMAGIVIDKPAVEGRYVQTGEPIYTLADLSRLWLMLDAFESQLPMLRYGQRIRFTAEGRPGETFEGTIAFIDPSVTSMTRTVRVRVNVDNRDGRLKPGMFVRALAEGPIGEHGLVGDGALAGKWVCPMHPEVVADAPGDCDICGMPLATAESLGMVAAVEDGPAPLIIPATAPLITGTRAIVYVSRPDSERPVFEGREVVLGPRAGDVYIVREGLQEGDVVVTNGAFRIDSAMQIGAKPSMMASGGGPAPGLHQHGQSPVPSPRPAIDHALHGALGDVYEAYFGVQEALAGDDLASARAAAAALGSQVGAPRSVSLDALRDAAAAVESASDIDAARIDFEALSAAALALEAEFGHAGDDTHYRVHCPMAFDFRGADWMQRSEPINNPYFGEAMLRCGTIEQEFAPAMPPGEDAS